MEAKIRCGWVGSDPLYQRYHDDVWGKPIYDAQELFAKLCLDGQQAGLSWLTILKKWDSYHEAYHNFDPAIIATFDDAKVESLLTNTGVIRNRAKVNSIIRNAKAYLNFVEQGNDFSEFLWSFVGGKPKQNHFSELSEIPTQTVESENMSKALKNIGFNFCGPTICYAFMQAVGMVDDHLTTCFCYKNKANH